MARTDDVVDVDVLLLLLAGLGLLSVEPWAGAELGIAGGAVAIEPCVVMGLSGLAEVVEAVLGGLSPTEELLAWDFGWWLDLMHEGAFAIIGC